MDSLPPHDLTSQERKKAYNKAYYQAHHEEIRKQQEEYRQIHSEEILSYQTAWREEHRNYSKEQAKLYRQVQGESINARRRSSYHANPEPAKRSAREYAQLHPEHVKARRKAHRTANFERYQARDRAYYHANKHDRVRLWNKVIKANRRARLAQTDGSYTVREWLSLKEHYNHTCLCCGRKEPDIKLTADHVMPIVKGGSSFIANIQPLCGSCNSKKHDKIIDYRTLWSNAHVN